MLCVVENLSESELKKLRNKRRKKAKQEALRLEKQRQEESRREAQKAKNPDAELDGPKEEELVPDKLAKVCSRTAVLLMYESVN